MIVKNTLTKKYMSIPKTGTGRKEYFEKIVFYQYGISLDIPKQDQVKLIQNNIIHFYENDPKNNK
jgi:hypothetical protein